ncbi:1995_t:CDS:2, partial [Gigaspora rosea]
MTDTPDSASSITATGNKTLTLKEVLEKYNLTSEGTEIIPLFKPQIYEIPDDNKHLKLYMAKIQLRLKSYGT